MSSPNHLARVVKETIESVMKEHPLVVPTAEVFRALYRFMEKEHVDGGCHFLTAMAHMLLKEAGVDSTLNAGWVQSSQGHYFTHSWTEIDGRVFDIAIARPNPHRREFQQSAVVYGVEVGARGPNGPTRTRYGVAECGPVDDILLFVGQGTVGTYAAGLPAIWERIVEVGGDAGLSLTATSLRSAHSDTRWILRTGKLNHA